MFPIEVRVNNPEKAFFVWSDGHAGETSWSKLRWNCPCAECSGEMGSPGKLNFLETLPESELTFADIEQIGAYALKIIWLSGHSTGLFIYSHLRALCECDLCMSENPHKFDVRGRLVGKHKT